MTIQESRDKPQASSKRESVTGITSKIEEGKNTFTAKETYKKWSFLVKIPMPV